MALSHEEAWTFCKLRAKYRTEHRAKLRQDAEDWLMTALAFSVFFGLVALAGIL